MKELKELEELGAVIEVTSNGLKLIGNWVNEYNPYHLLFTEITGYLPTYNTKQNKDFLRNLTNLGYLYINNTIQDKDFLKNLTQLGYLHTSDDKQDKDFLKNLTNLGKLDTSNTIQDKDFLRNLNSLGYLYTPYIKQDKDFLRNLNSLGYLYTPYIKQDKDFLRNLTHLCKLDTSNTKQDENFLRNLNSLGKLDTSNTKQDKNFLRNVSYDFKEPYIYADGILSIIHSKKVIDDITVYVTNRIGYKETEYIASDGNNYAHAKSIKLALLDLRFKSSDRDTSWLEDKSLEDILSFDDSILSYRLITGACSGGVEEFLKSKSLKESYKIEEIIDLSKNQYGHKEYENFFKVK